VSADRSIGRPEFRLRPGGASNKAHRGADWAGTVELVDKQSLFGCDPASSVPEQSQLVRVRNSGARHAAEKVTVAGRLGPQRPKACFFNEITYGLKGLRENSKSRDQCGEIRERAREAGAKARQILNRLRPD
jgi:hypothetical protein